jgi:hypothetical protein
MRDQRQHLHVDHGYKRNKNLLQKNSPVITGPIKDRDPVISKHSVQEIAGSSPAMTKEEGGSRPLKPNRITPSPCGSARFCPILSGHLPPPWQGKQRVQRCASP